MRSQIIKALIFNKQVRLYLVNNTHLIEEISQIHENTNLVVKEALAHSLSAISVVSATLKGNQRLSVTLSMNNPKNKIHVDADAQGNIRGYANDSLLSNQDNYSSVKDIIGTRGSIRMIKGNEMNQFTGITDMPYQNLDEDFSHYFKQSDQTETLIKTTIDWQENKRIKNSYGMYAQLLPQSAPQLLDNVDEHYQAIQEVLQDLPTLNDEKISSVLNNHFGEAEIIGHATTQFFCGCSKEMFFGLLHSIDKVELKEHVLSHKPIRSTCNRCGRHYSFNLEEINPLLEAPNE